METRRRQHRSYVVHDEIVAVEQRRHRPDYRIMLYMGLLMMLGLVVLYAIGPARANVMNHSYNTNVYSQNYFVLKQVASLAMALVAFFAMASIRYTALKKMGWRLVQIGFGLCALLFIAGNVLHIDQIAQNTLGAYRWFTIGSFGFQPAEALKFALLIYMSAFLGKRYQEGKINSMNETVWPMCAISALALLFVVFLQKDMGTGIAIISMITAMFVMSTMRWKILAKIALACLAIGVIAIIAAPHRMQRVETFFMGDSAASSSAEAGDSNYQIKNAMIALGSGGLFGRGIGRSIQATGYLPEATNDSIFAIMGEIFGFIGTTLIIGIFAALLLRLLKITDYLEDMSMRLAVAGVFGWLGAHVMMNIASMIGVMPLTGITLPLLSFGGTSMVFITGALGLAFQLSRYTAREPILVNKEHDDENTRGRRGIGRPRYAGRRRPQGN